MNRKWFFLCVGVLFGGLLFGAATTPTNGAATIRPSQVEVTNFPNPQNVAGSVNVGNLPSIQNVAGSVTVGNFPATQGVTGTVNVGNLPASQVVAGIVNVGNLPSVQDVTGEVMVGNLPVDGSGNLRVADQGHTGSASVDVELRFLQVNSALIALPWRAQQNVFLPLIPVPPGLNRVSVSVQSLDLGKAQVNALLVGFGTPSAPLIHVPSVGDVLFFPYAPIIEEGGGSSQASSSVYRVQGPLMQVSFEPFIPGLGVVTPPPDTDYYVHLHFSTE